jgi:hypothetical protein
VFRLKTEGSVYPTEQYELFLTGFTFPGYLNILIQGTEAQQSPGFIFKCPLQIIMSQIYAGQQQA